MSKKSNRGIFPKNFIKELREQRGWTLRDLEEKTGWSSQVVSNLELSKSDLTWTKLQRLAEVFECHELEITQGPAVAVARDQQEQDLLARFRSFAEGEKQMFSHMLSSYDSDKPVGSDKPADRKPAKEKSKK